MGSSHIRGILTAFSPTLDLFALSLGDGRIKVRSFYRRILLNVKKGEINSQKIVLVYV